MGRERYGLTYEIRTKAKFNPGDALIVVGVRETQRGFRYFVVREPKAAEVTNGK